MTQFDIHVAASEAVAMIARAYASGAASPDVKMACANIAAHLRRHASAEAMAIVADIASELTTLYTSENLRSPIYDFREALVAQVTR